MLRSSVGVVYAPELVREHARGWGRLLKKVRRGGREGRGRESWGLFEQGGVLILKGKMRYEVKSGVRLRVRRRLYVLGESVALGPFGKGARPFWKTSHDILVLDSSASRHSPTSACSPVHFEHCPVAHTGNKHATPCTTASSQQPLFGAGTFHLPPRSASISHLAARLQ